MKLLFLVPPRYICSHNPDCLIASFGTVSPESIGHAIGRIPLLITGTVVRGRQCKWPLYALSCSTTFLFLCRRFSQPGSQNSRSITIARGILNKPFVRCSCGNCHWRFRKKYVIPGCTCDSCSALIATPLSPLDDFNKTFPVEGLTTGEIKANVFMLR